MCVGVEGKFAGKHKIIDGRVCLNLLQLFHLNHHVPSNDNKLYLSNEGLKVHISSLQVVHLKTIITDKPTTKQQVEIVDHPINSVYCDSVVEMAGHMEE